MSDIISGLLFVVFSTGVYLIALQLPPGRGNAPGPAFFPELTAVLGVVVGLAICVRAAVALRRRAGSPTRRVTGDSVGDALRLALLLAVSIAYVVGLRPVGFLIASGLFLVVSLLILGERRVLILVLVPAGLTGVIHLVFTSLLGLRLPAGALF
jgi:putative tricarboxylic transport membrane protein